MRTIAYLLAVAAVPIALPAGPSNAAAQERTRVLVEFRIEEPTYRDRFPAAELAELERTAGRRIAAVLAAQLPVLLVVTEPPADHRLVVSLHRRGREQGSRLGERGFLVSLQGPVSTTEEYWTTFRPAEMAGLGLGTQDAFLEEIVSRFAQGDVDLLVEKHLSRVPLSHDGKFLPNPLGWLVPISLRAACMDVDSELLVRNQLPTIFGPVREDFLAHAKQDVPAQAPPPFDRFRDWLFSKPVPGQPNLGDLTRVAEPDSVTVEAIYLVRFRPDQTRCQLPAPPGAGGGAP